MYKSLTNIYVVFKTQNGFIVPLGGRQTGTET